MNKWSLRLFRAGCVAFLPLALVYGGGFPIRQGVVLGLLMAWLVFLIGKTAVKPVRRFIPYWVRVSPDWYQILTDFRLISGPEEWRSVLQSVESSADYSVLRDGALLTVVQQSEDFEHTLVFSNQHQAFGSEFQFEEDMTPIQFEKPFPIGHSPARFFMNPYPSEKGVAGCSLGIAVRAWWWEEVKASCAAPLAVNTNHLTGTVELTLATLPFAEFDVYWELADRWTNEYVLKTEQIRRRRDEHREKLGWKDKTSSDEDGVGIRFPVSIEHKYFSVEHREV